MFGTITTERLEGRRVSRSMSQWAGGPGLRLAALSQATVLARAFRPGLNRGSEPAAASDLNWLVVSKPQNMALFGVIDGLSPAQIDGRVAVKVFPAAYRPKTDAKPQRHRPAKAGRLPSPLPTTLVITDEADVLREEGEQYANKLREAGVDATSVRVAGMVHDFLLLDSLRDTRAANVARKFAVDALRTAVQDG